MNEWMNLQYICPVPRIALDIAWTDNARQGAVQLNSTTPMLNKDNTVLDKTAEMLITKR